MKTFKKVLVYGFFIWLIPFIISFAIFPLRGSNRALFESIMPVVIAICAVIFTALSFKFIDLKFVRNGAIYGFSWMLISIALDLIVFLREPMNMSLYEYFIDIGIAYLIIPVIAIGTGFAFENKIGWLNK
mgnify:CR=1 FL=1|jgi:hypothetical protein